MFSCDFSPIFEDPPITSLENTVFSLQIKGEVLYLLFIFGFLKIRKNASFFVIFQCFFSGFRNIFSMIFQWFLKHFSIRFSSILNQIFNGLLNWFSLRSKIVFSFIKKRSRGFFSKTILIFSRVFWANFPRDSFPDFFRIFFEVSLAQWFKFYKLKKFKNMKMNEIHW